MQFFLIMFVLERSERNGKKMKNTKQAIKLIFEISKIYFFLQMVKAVIQSLFPIISALFLTRIIDEGVYNLNIYDSCLYAIYLAGISVIYTFGKNRLDHGILKINQRIELNINRKIIFKLSTIEYSFFDNTELYNNVEHASREIKTLEVIIDDFVKIISSIISICIILPYLLRINIILLLVVVISNIPIAIYQIKLKKQNLEFSKKSVYCRRCASGTENMLINKYYADEVRIFSLVDWMYKRYKQYMIKAFNIEEKRNKKTCRYNIFTQCIMAAMTLVVQIILIRYIVLGVITVGKFTLFNTYIIRFGNCIFDIVSSVSSIYEKEIFLNNLFSFLNDFEERPKLDSVENKLEGSLHSIEFDNVSFKYDNSDYYVLNNVSFKLEAGKKLAIVGLNGAGKTTIFKLILRFYKPVSGEILLDGKDIYSYDINDYYNAISVIFQSPKLYPWSLKENVVFGNTEIKIQHFDWFEELINRYPNGLSTTILPYFDSKGIEPSMGESQRIALVRALCKDAGILLMDEPSASMDAEIEYKIFSDLNGICGNKTAIIISHRLSVVTTADKIIYLKDAKILEEGNHLELMNKEGEYKKLFLMQAEKYIKSK